MEPGKDKNKTACVRSCVRAIVRACVGEGVEGGGGVSYLSRGKVAGACGGDR